MYIQCLIIQNEVSKMERLIFIANEEWELDSNTGFTFWLPCKFKICERLEHATSRGSYTGDTIYSYVIQY